jgi:arginyl-tRNA synthetase
MPDIAYHNIKLSRGYDKIFNIWGSDHKSYADRMKIAIQLLGYRKDQLETLIMQMVRLVKDGQEFKMSKRSGNSLTLQDLLDTIGKDAARWYLVSQSLSTHLEIDVTKATSQNNDNPLYYVQYAHARVNQLSNNTKFEQPKSFDLLTTPSEVALINMLHFYKHTIEVISTSYEVNKMTLYLTNLAKAFHS